MHYTTSIIIDRPRAEVLKLFDNLDNIKHWQRNLVSFEILNGKQGEVGTKSKMTYNNGMELIETVTVKNLPHEFSGTYTAKGVWNEIKNYFEETPDGKTKWTSDCTFQMSGAMKIMALLFPFLFKGQSKKMMNDFKNFAEKGTSVQKNI
jgi:uncharacterized membrane protein